MDADFAAFVEKLGANASDSSPEAFDRYMNSRPVEWVTRKLGNRNA